MAQKGRLLFEENSKKYYEATEPGLLVQNAGDPFDPVAIINQRVTDQILQGLSAIGIHNQFVKQLNMHEALVYDVEKMPITTRLQLRANETDSKLLDTKIGAVFSRPICDMRLKSNDFERPINADDLVTLGLISEFELDEYRTLMLRVSDYLSGFYHAIGATLVSYTFGIGRQYIDEYHSILVLTDDLSPLGSVIWDCADYDEDSPHALDVLEIGNRLKLLP